MNGRIALIIPYFGALPKWFPYFMQSVAHSPILNVILFTDAGMATTLPTNVEVHSLTLSDFERKASQKMSIPVSLTHTFKVCDFKPAFGDIFQEYIQDYEFWAFGDIDLIYGDVQLFLNPLLQMHDVISCRKNWVSGSLCVLRNCNEVNYLYRLSADWKRAFREKNYMMFDEMGGHFFSAALKGENVLSLKGNIESFTHILLKSSQQGLLRCAFIDMACEDIDWNQSIVYDAGTLTRCSDNSAVMYVHFVCMKRRFFEVPKLPPTSDRFYIRKTGIYMNRPSIKVIIFQESFRIIHGSIRAVSRLLYRLIS